MITLNNTGFIKSIFFNIFLMNMKNLNHYFFLYL